MDRRTRCVGRQGVSTHTDIYTKTGFYIPIHIDTYTKTGFYIHIHTDTYTKTGFYIPIHTDMYTKTGFYIPIHTDMYTKTGFYIHVHIDTYTKTGFYIPIHTDMYTKTGFYIPIHTDRYTKTGFYIHIARKHIRFRPYRDIEMEQTYSLTHLPPRVDLQAVIRGAVSTMRIVADIKNAARAGRNSYHINHKPADLSLGASSVGARN